MEKGQDKFDSNSNEQKGFVSRFLNFDSFITPNLIKYLYIIGVVIFVLIGLGIIIGGISRPYGGGMLILSGIIMIIIAPFMTRISAEILIVKFKTLEVLKDINKKM